MAEFTISLKAARVNTEMSRGEVAEKIGVSESSISNWELGRCKVDAIKLRALSEVYKIPMEFLRLPNG